MKKILQIARLELNILFYSPIAWFLLIVFLFQCGLSYTSNINGWIMSQELGGYYSSNMKDLTRNIFSFPQGTFIEISSKLYLYLPLLTMGVMSREISSGTIKLLYSSPIKVREIVFGKFLAMMTYCLLLVAVMAIFVFSGFAHIKSADYGLLFSGLLGLYLLLCAYTAIGLFMSCLTSYQVVAALCTLVVLGLLSYIGTVWQEYDFFRDLTGFLSLSGRTEKMLLGLITTRDVFYFGIIVFIFLGFSMCKLRAGRESKRVLIKIARYGLILALALVAGYATSRPGWIGYYDATSNKNMTLTPASRQIIQETGNTPLEITTYINLLERHYFYGRPDQRNADLARWEPYRRFKPEMKFKYVYYYDSSYDKTFNNVDEGKSLREMAAVYAKTTGVDMKMFLTPSTIRKEIDLRPELNRYVMQLKLKDRQTFLRVFDDMFVFPTEMETDAALKRLVGQVPRVLFVTGNLERSIEKTGDPSYQALASEKSFRFSLVNQGFDVDTISLKTQDIPSNIAVLVIADPKTVLAAEELGKIQKYIEGGGNLLVIGEPGKGAVLNPILQPLNVQLMDGTLIQPSKDNAPNIIFGRLTPVAAGFSKPLREAFGDTAKILMPGAAALSYTNTGTFNIQPILMTEAKISWNKKESILIDSAEIIYSAASGDTKGPFPVALSLTRPLKDKEQRIVVCGDADLLSNIELRRISTIKTANYQFGTALFSWFTYGRFPIDASRPKAKDTGITLTGEGLKSLKVVYLGVLPGALLLFGIVLLTRRKRK